MRLLGRLIRDCLIVCGVVFLLFCAVNLLAIPFARSTTGDADDVFAEVYDPRSQKGVEIYERVFKTDDPVQALARLNASPSFAAHPTLEFITQPVNNRYFHVGLEGIRYEPQWDDRKVASLLGGKTPLIFAFGGSTMLGHGVAGDETIPYFMNKAMKLPEGAVAINLGAQAYDQNLELAKLVYLLKAGYRPKQVIFLDGWNDLFLARSNMRLPDKVVFHGFSVSRGEVAFTPHATINRPHYLKLLIRSLPIYRALFDRPRPLSVADLKFDRNAFTDGFDFREADYLFRNWAAFGELHRDRLKQEMIDYYRENLELLSALSSHYQFKATVFYQPIGLFDPANPFVRPQARRAPGYRYLSDMSAVARQQIAAGTLSMVDLSGALADLKDDRYIDVAHYSPAANERLAAAIISHLFH
jgi:hypothetical protein